MSNKMDAYDIAIKQWKKGKERGGGIPAKVYDVIVFHYGEDYRPIIIKKHLVKPKDEDIEDKVKLGRPKSIKEVIQRIKSLDDHNNETWFFVINLPAGLNFENFKKLEQTFADALGETGNCQIEQHGMAVHMTISNVNRTKMYPYNFDPTSYLKKGMMIPIPFGYSINGFIVKDLAEILTLLVCGMMGSGKSNFSHTAIYTMLLINSIKGIDKEPSVIPVICDPKLGEFKYFEKYGAMWAKESQHIERLLQQVNDENDRRSPIVSKTGARNFPEFLKLGNKMPAIVVICDEMAEFTSPAYESFNRLLHQGRSQGIFSIGAIQRPSANSLGKIGNFSELKAMFDGNLVYRVKDPINSNMVLGNSKAAFIPKKAKGRAIFDWDEEIEVQSMYFPSVVSDPDKYEELLSKLIQYPMPYTDIQGEVYDYESNKSYKGLLPRFKSINTSRTLYLLEHNTNPFT